MIKHTRIWTVIAALLLLLACAPGENNGDARPAPADELPPASVLIVHRVADYDAWKSVFDEHMPARKEASCLGHYLKRGIDDPEMVYVYCVATDVEKLRAFLDSADLAEAMKNAGVQGTPQITLMKPMTRDLVAQRKLPGIIIMHSVEDYPTWRVAYDAFDDIRRKSGIVGHAVSRELSSPNNVVVYHQAEDVAALRAFVESAELRETMQRAGVVGAPDIRFIEVVDFGEY